MSIELKEAAQQVVDAFDAFGDADDFASLFELTQKMRALRTTIQQAEAQQPATGKPVVDVRCEGCGYMTHHREHMGCVRAAKQHTHQAPSVPADVVRDAERYRWLRNLDHWPAPFSSSQEPEPVRGRDLDAAIDAAMLAAQDSA